MRDPESEPTPLFLRNPRAEVFSLRFPSLDALPRIGAQHVETLQFGSVDALDDDASGRLRGGQDDDDVGMSGAFGGSEDEDLGRDEEKPSNIVAISLQAYSEGFSQGRSEGRAAAQDEIRAAVGYLLAATETVRGHRLKTVTTLEAELVDLAMSIARRVLRAEVSVAGHEVAMRLGQAAIARIGDCDRVTVRLSPDDLRGLGHGGGSPQDRVVFIADPSLSRGDALVESEHGRVDARLENQLDELMTALHAPPAEGEGSSREARVPR